MQGGTTSWPLYLQDQSLYTVNLGLQFYRSAYQVSSLRWVN